MFYWQHFYTYLTFEFNVDLFVFFLIMLHFQNNLLFETENCYLIFLLLSPFKIKCVAQQTFLIMFM